jgi:hypothetical protein
MRYLLTRSSVNYIDEDDFDIEEVTCGEYWNSVPNYIEINSIEELTQLQKEVGDLIIKQHWDTDEDCIEIYDGYRE